MNKDQAIVVENSRELIKLVDYFVTKNNKISEKLVSLTISLLDQIRAFDNKYQSMPERVNTSPNISLNTSLNTSTTETRLNTSQSGNTNIGQNTSGVGSNLSGLLNSYGIVHDEWSETSYLGMNILVNVICSDDIEICAQASAKINTILHSRTITNSEEACYLIASVEKVMFERLKEGDDEHYAFLIPIMKCLIEKCHSLLQMNVQVPNIPFNNVSPTFYEDFKEYCKSDEWRIFIQKQV